MRTTGLWKYLDDSLVLCATLARIRSASWHALHGRLVAPSCTYEQALLIVAHFDRHPYVGRAFLEGLRTAKYRENDGQDMEQDSSQEIPELGYLYDGVRLWSPFLNTHEEQFKDWHSEGFSATNADVKVHRWAVQVWRINFAQHSVLGEQRSV